MALNGEAAPAQKPLKEINHSIHKVTNFSSVNDELRRLDTKLSSSETFVPPTNKNLEDIIEKAKIDLSLPIEKPSVCISILSNGKEAIQATYGNFSACIAKAKNGRTYAVSLLISALLKRGDIHNTIRPAYLPGKNIIRWYDTEQGRYHVQKVGKRVLHVAGINPTPNFEILCLRSSETKERLAAIEHDIYSTPGLAVVVIDGIRDLIYDINDAEEASMITGKLLKWSEELNIHIIIVLHQNKGDNNARGHVGTEIINKAETVMTVTKDQENDLFIIEPERCREMEFKPLAFAIDEIGMPYIVENWTPEQPKDKKSKVSAAHIDDDFHKQRLKEAFKIDSKPSYTNAWLNIKTAFEPFQSIGNNAAKEFLSFYQLKGWVKKDENSKRNPPYLLNLPV